MQSFPQFIESWHDFYMMSGTAAATLVGLLFVALSLNIERINRDQHLPLLAIAAQTFSNFIYVLLFSIVFLIPDQSPWGVGLPLLGMGLVGTASLLFQFGRALQDRNPLWKTYRLFWRFVVPLLSFLMLTGIGMATLLGEMYILYWLIAAIIMLLASGSRNAWDLLVRWTN